MGKIANSKVGKYLIGLGAALSLYSSKNADSLTINLEKIHESIFTAFEYSVDPTMDTDELKAFLFPWNYLEIHQTLDNSPDFNVVYFESSNEIGGFRIANYENEPFYFIVITENKKYMLDDVEGTGYFWNGNDYDKVTFTIQVPVSPVPEPGTLFLMGTGVAGLLMERKFSKRRKKG